MLFAGENPVLEMSNQAVSDVQGEQHAEFSSTESARSPQSSAEIKNALIYIYIYIYIYIHTFTPRHVLVMRCEVNHRESFTAVYFWPHGGG